MEKKEKIAKDIADRFFTAYPNSSEAKKIYSTAKNTLLKEMIEERLSELSKLNPYKINEERFMKIFLTTKITSSGYSQTLLPVIVNQYNSTLQEPPQQLKPLPQEMPEWFNNNLFLKQDLTDTWKEITKHYGTPQKAELPSVEELADKILALDIISNGSSFSEISKTIARYIIDTYKYALHSPKKEWWMDLKKGGKFVFVNSKVNKVVIFDGIIDVNNGVFLGNEENSLRYDVNFCTPHIESEFQREYDKHSLHPDTKKLIKLACEEAIKTRKAPEL